MNNKLINKIIRGIKHENKKNILIKYLKKIFLLENFDTQIHV
jgi:hypothetical protein